MFLGIDGGGTKTEMILTDDMGFVTGHTIGSCSNPGTLSEKELLENIRMPLEGLFGTASDCRNFSGSVFAGMSGAGLAENKTRLENVFAALLPAAGKITVAGDYMNVMTAGLDNGDGVIVISGTGSCVCARRNGEVRRFGGWGHLIGDPASGYELGREALYHLLSVEEGLSERTILSDSVRGRLGYDCDENIMKIYDGGKKFIASFAPAVTDSAERGCLEAINIIENNGKTLAKLIDSALGFVGKDVSDLVFAGSVFEKTSVVKEAVLRNLRGNVNVISGLRPVAGAVLSSYLNVVNDEDKREIFKENLLKSMSEEELYVGKRF